MGCLGNGWWARGEQGNNLISEQNMALYPYVPSLGCEALYAVKTDVTKLSTLEGFYLLTGTATYKDNFYQITTVQAFYRRRA